MKLIAEYAEIDTNRYTSRVTSEAEEGDGDLLEPDDRHLDDDEDEDNYEDERALAELDDEDDESRFEDDAWKHKGGLKSSSRVIPRNTHEAFGLIIYYFFCPPSVNTNMGNSSSLKQ